MTGNLKLWNFLGQFSKIVHFLAYLGQLCPENVFMPIIAFVYPSYRYPENFLPIRPRFQQLLQKSIFIIFYDLKKRPLLYEHVQKLQPSYFDILKFSELDLFYTYFWRICSF